MLDGEKMKLGIIVLELTNRCNLKCKYCSIEKDNIKDMKINIINYIENLKIETLILSGGEPFLHPNFEEILEKCCKKFKYVGITTNGTLVSEKFITKFSKFDNLTVQVSIDGIEKVHNFFRGEGSYQLVSNNIKKLLSKNMNVQTITVLTKDNIYLIDKMVNEIEKIGIKKIAFERFTPIGSGIEMKDKALNKDDLKWLTEHLKQNNFFNKKVHINDPIINLDKHTTLKNKSPFLPCAGCFAGIKNFVIDMDGFIKICTRIPIKIARLQDFHFESLLDNKILKRLLFRDFEGKCKLCDKIMICGGCRAEAFAREGNLFAGDEACWR